LQGPGDVLEAAGPGLLEYDAVWSLTRIGQHMDQQELTAYLAFIVSVFALMNPLAAVPVYLGLTTDLDPETRRRIPFKTATAAFVIMVIAFIAGETILDMFSVSIPALRIAGGIVILSMGWSMLQAKTSRTKQTEEEAEEATSRDSIAIIPMAIPMTAGPGAISLMVVKASYQNPIEGQIAIILGVLLVCVVLWLFLKSATKISSVLGQTGMNIVTRIMGLLMLGVGVEFMAQGAGEMFPGLLAT
jgi:multiple antibiotic resistance protein